MLLGFDFLKNITIQSKMYRVINCLRLQVAHTLYYSIEIICDKTAFNVLDVSFLNETEM